MKKRTKKQIRAQISTSLQIYWGQLKRASEASGIPIKQLRRKLKNRRNNAQGAFSRNLKQQKIKGGRKNKYVIVVWMKEKGGRIRMSTIRGIGASNSKKLKQEIEYEIKKVLQARGYVLERYLYRFKKAIKKYPDKFTVISDFRFNITKM